MGCSACALLLFALVGLRTESSAQDGAEEEMLDIVAETVSLDSAQSQARFSGGVRAQRGEWVLQCEALLVSYSSTGEVLEANAEGPVILANRELRIEAPSARYDQEKGLVTMSGGATVRRGQSVVEAKTAVLDLSSETVELSGVVGRVRLGDLKREGKSQSESAPVP
jgi:lipopolysaccharide transport protein LptA